jgi:hypothetical protein
MPLDDDGPAHFPRTTPPGGRMTFTCALATGSSYRIARNGAPPSITSGA